MQIGKYQTNGKMAQNFGFKLKKRKEKGVG